MPGTVDLFVLTLGADQCYDVMKDLVDHGKARSVILIAGGMGEKEGGASIEGRIRDLLGEGRRSGRTTPVVNGGNCLGIVSKPGLYDTLFIPDHKLPRPKRAGSATAMISQSGAFMICRMSKLPSIEPVYSVSLGNQIDLTASDYLNYLKDDPEVRTFSVYMEGFKPGDGLAFARAIREITASGRTVLVYKAGRSPEGRSATSSHTASVAGDYGVFKAVCEQAGAIVAEDLFEFESFMKGLAWLEGRVVRGRRVGLVSNAGFECVMMADNLKDGDRARPGRVRPGDARADPGEPPAARHRPAPRHPQPARRDPGRGRRRLHGERPGVHRGPGRRLRRHLQRAPDQGPADAAGGGGARRGPDPARGLRVEDDRDLPLDGQAHRRQHRLPARSTIPWPTISRRPGSRSSGGPTRRSAS